MADPDPDKHRAQLAQWARRKDCRALGFPRRWNPGAVINPVSGLPFTDSNAWELIADFLEGGHPIRTIVMNKPPGKTAYVLVVELTPGEMPLYIKVHFGTGKIIGRSFHISEPMDEIL